MATGWLSRNDFTGSDYVQASDLNNLHDDIVTWKGDVNGGGFRLSNVILDGVTTQSGGAVSSVFGRTGDVVAKPGDYTAAMVGAVPSTVQIIAGSGMTGGGSLTGNVTLNAQVTSVFGRIGAITLTPADITGAMGVVQARAVNAGAGLQGGGNLASDITLSVIPGDSTQQLQFLQGGGVIATRHGLNFISGANVTVAVTDNSASGRVDVTISSTGGGSGMVDPTTTKGDVIVRGPSITSRLPVGTDGQVLTADSTQSLGVRWAAASGSGAVATVFGRTGAVVAATGDYSAAQVTNAVDRSQTYSDPMWLTGLNWSKILNPPVFLADPTTTKGDLIVRSASALARLPVGGDGSILVADSAQASGVRWGASPSAIPAGQYAGDMLIWQQTGGWGLLSAAGQPAAVGNVLTVQSVGASTKLVWQAPPPPQATTYFVNGTQVTTGTFGLNIVAGNNTAITGALDGSGTRTNITITAGGPSGGLADPTTTKGDLIARSSSQVTRLPIGTDGTVLMADSTQPMGMKWATVSGGSGGGAQTPWTSNIDAAGYTLSNIPVIQSPANGNLILNSPGSSSYISLQIDGGTAAMLNNSNLLVWGEITANVNFINGRPPSIALAGYGSAQWIFTGTSSPTTPGTNLLTIQCLNQSAGVYAMNDLGHFGVGVANPAYAVDAAGDCNITGVYRIAGSPLAAAQVVNAVSTTGSYADPAWITSLAWSKIQGAPATGVTTVFGRAGAVVAQTGDYSAAQVTNAVDQTGSYANPSWITSIPYSKITGAPAAAGQTPWLSNIDAANFNLNNVNLVTAVSFQTPVSTTANTDLISFKASCSQNTSSVNWYGVIGSVSGGLMVAGVSHPSGAPIAGNVVLTSGTDLVFSTSGYAAAKMVIKAGGNVGIGTSAPGGKFTVSGVGSSGGGVCDVQIIGTGIIGSGISLASQDTGGKLWSIFSAGSAVGAGGLGFYDATVGSYGLFISSAHNVGIGTTGPWAGLTVVGPAAAPSLTAQSVATASISANGPTNELAFFNNTGGLVAIQARDKTAASSYPLCLNPLGGVVGIGTTTPNATVALHAHIAANQNIAFQSITSIATLNSFTDGAPAQAPMQYYASGHYFMGGNVGIATTGPLTTMHVAGASTDFTGELGTLLITGGANQYRLAMGYNSSTNCGWIQAVQNGVGQTNLVLQGEGGSVGIGPGAASSPINNGALMITSAGSNSAARPAVGATRIRGEISAIGASGPGEDYGFLRLSAGGGTTSGYKSFIDLAGFSQVGDVVNTITFGVGNVERMRITGAGLVGIQNTNPGFTLHLGLDSAAKPGTSTWIINSDARVKKNVSDLVGGLDIISRLRVIEAEYNGLDGTQDGQRVVSFLANEVLKVLPHCVVSHRGTLGKEQTEVLDLNIHEILMHLVLAVQQLAKKN